MREGMGDDAEGAQEVSAVIKGGMAFVVSGLYRLACSSARYLLFWSSALLPSENYHGLSPASKHTLP